MWELLKQLSLVALGLTPYWIGSVVYERKQLGLQPFDGLTALFVPPADPNYPESVAARYTSIQEALPAKTSVTVIPNGDRCTEPQFELRDDGVPLYTGCADPGGIIYQTPYPTIHELVTSPDAFAIAKPEQETDAGAPEPAIAQYLQYAKGRLFGSALGIYSSLMLSIVGFFVLLRATVAINTTLKTFRQEIRDKDVVILKLRKELENSIVRANDLVDTATQAENLIARLQDDVLNRDAEIKKLKKEQEAARLREHSMTDVSKKAEESIDRLYDDIEDRSGQIKKLKRELEDARVQQKAMVDTYINSNRLIDRLRDDVQNRDAEIDRLKNQVQDAKVRKEATADASNQAPTPSSPPSSSSSLPPSTNKTKPPAPPSTDTSPIIPTESKAPPTKTKPEDPPESKTLPTNTKPDMPTKSNTPKVSPTNTKPDIPTKSNTPPTNTKPKDPPESKASPTNTKPEIPTKSKAPPTNPDPKTPIESKRQPVARGGRPQHNRGGRPQHMRGGRPSHTRGGRHQHTRGGRPHQMDNTGAWGAFADHIRNADRAREETLRQEYGDSPPVPPRFNETWRPRNGN